MPFFYEDFSEGQVFDSTSRNITKEDIQKFGELSGDFNKLHFDPEFACTAGFRDVVAHGLLTLSISLGLWHSLGLTNGTIVAFAGLSNVAFKAPVYPGDSVYLRGRVVAKRELASRKDSGLVRMNLQTFNQKEDLVLECEVALLVRRNRKP